MEGVHFDVYLAIAIIGLWPVGAWFWRWVAALVGSINADAGKGLGAVVG